MDTDEGGDTAVSAEAAGFVSGNSQTTEVMNGTNTAGSGRLRGGSNGNQVTQNAFFFSAANGQSALKNPDWNAWVSGEVRRYSDDADGNSFDVSMGADRMIGTDALAGVVLAYGKLDLETSATDVSVTSPAIGGYFATKLSDDVYLDAFLLFARPEYEVDGGSFTADRTSIGVAVSGTYQTDTMEITPVLSLRASREEHPEYTSSAGTVAENTLESLTAYLGATVQPLERTAGGFLPFVSLGGDFHSRDSLLTGSSNFSAARLGLCFSQLVGAGELSFAIDGGTFEEGIRDVGGTLSFTMSF